MFTGWETKECTEITPVLPTARQKFLRHFTVYTHTYIYMEFFMIFKNCYIFTATYHGTPNDILWNPNWETLF